MADNDNMHSLSAQIGFDISNAEQTLGKLKTLFEEINGSISKIHSNTSNLNKTTVDKINDFIKNMKVAQSVEITDTDDIDNAIETAIKKRIKSIKLNMKLPEGDGLIKEVELPKTTITEWKKQMESILKRIASDVKVVFPKTKVKDENGKSAQVEMLGNIKIPNETLENIKGQIQHKLNMMLTNPKLSSLEFEDGDAMKRRFVIGKEHMDKMIDTINTRIFELLSDSKNIIMPKVNTLNFDRPEISELIKRLRTVLTNAVSDMVVKDTIVDDLSGIKISTADFYTKLEKFVKDAKNVSKVLKSIDFSEVNINTTASKEDMEKTAGEFEKLKSRMSTLIHAYFSSLTKKINDFSKTPDDSTDKALVALIAEIEKSVGNYLTNLHNKFKVNINDLGKSSIGNELAALQLSFLSLESAMAEFLKLSANDLDKVKKIIADLPKEFTKLANAIVSNNKSTDSVIKTELEKVKAELEKFDNTVKNHIVKAGETVDAINTLLMASNFQKDNYADSIATSIIGQLKILRNTIEDAVKLDGNYFGKATSSITLELTQLVDKIEKEIVNSFKIFSSNVLTSIMPHIINFEENLGVKVKQEIIEQLKKIVSSLSFSDNNNFKIELDLPTSVINEKIKTAIINYLDEFIREVIIKTNEQKSQTVSFEDKDYEHLKSKLRIAIADLLDAYLSNTKIEYDKTTALWAVSLNSEILIKRYQSSVNELIDANEKVTKFIYNSPPSTLEFVVKEEKVRTKFKSALNQLLTKYMDSVDFKFFSDAQVQSAGADQAVDPVVKAIQTAMNSFKKKINTKIITDFKSSLGNLEQVYNVFVDDIVKSIKDMVNLLVSHESFKNVQMKVELDYEKLKHNIKPDIIKAVNSIIDNLDFDPINVQKMMLKVPEDELVKSIHQMVIDRINLMINEIKNKKVAGLPSKEKAAFNQTVKDLTTDLVQKMITSSLTIVKDVKDEFEKTNVISLKPKEVEAILKTLDVQLVDALMDRLKKTAHFMYQAVAKVSSTPVDFKQHYMSLDNEVRRQIAEAHNMTTKQFEKKNKFLNGDKGLQTIMEANMQIVMNRFNKVIGDQATKIVDFYKDALTKVDIKPQANTLSLLITRFTDLQEAITKKAKEIFDEQFKAMIKEINAVSKNPLNYVFAYNTKTKVIRTPSQTIINNYNAPTNRSMSSPYSRPYPVNTTGFAPSAPMRQFNNQLGDGTYWAGGSLWKNGEKIEDPGGHTRSFMGSVVNTMRYMTAGAIMGTPTMLGYKAMDAYLESDYQFTKAKVNLMAKDENNNELKSWVNNDMKKAVQSIAVAYSIPQLEAAKAFQVATQGYDNPLEALNLTRSAAKLRAVEEIDVEQSSKGLQAVASQYHLSGDQIRDFSNMMILAANLKLTKVEDLLEIQKRTGATFKQALPDMSTRQQLATAIGMSTLYTQSTGKSGNMGGTFFKNLLASPFTQPARAKLEEMSAIKGLERLNPYEKVFDDKGKPVMDAFGFQSKKQKNSLDLLLDITDIFPKLDDSARGQIFDLLSRWFRGDVAALISDIERVNNNPNVKKSGGVRSFIDELQGYKTDEKGNRVKMSEEEAAKALEETTSRLAAMTMDAMKFKTQRVETGFEVASTNLIDAFRSEFSILLEKTAIILRLIGDNATGISQIISLLTKLAIGYGIQAGARYIGENLKYRAQKEIEKKEKEKYDKLTDYVNKKRSVMQEEGRFINVSREMRAAKIADDVEKFNKTMAMRDKSKAGLDNINYQLENLKSNDKALNDTRTTLVAQNATPAQINAIDQEISKNQQKINEFERRKQLAQTTYDTHDTAYKTQKVNIRKAQNENDIDNMRAIGFNNRVEMFEQETELLGVDKKDIKTPLTKVSDSANVYDLASQYMENQIKRLGNNTQITKQELDGLNNEFDQLKLEFSSGALSIEDFIKKLQRLERQLRNIRTPVQVDDAQSPVKLNTVGSQPDDKAEGVGFLNLLAGLGVMQGLTSNATPPDVNAPNTPMSRGQRIARGLGSAVSMAGQGLVSASLGVGASVGFSALTNSYISGAASEAENKSMKADETKSMINRVYAARKAKEEGKWFQGFMLDAGAGFAIAYNNLSSLFGATNTLNNSELSDLNALSNASSTAAGFKQLANSTFDPDLKSVEARMQMIKEQEELDKKMPGLDVNKDGKADMIGKDYKDLVTFEEGQQANSYILQNMQNKLQVTGSKTSVNKIDLLLKGYSETSTEITNLLSKSLDENIKILEEAISEMRKNLGRYNPSHPAYQGALAQVTQVEAQLAEEKRKKQLNMLQSPIDTKMTEFDRSNTALSANANIDFFNLYQKGNNSTSLRWLARDKEYKQKLLAVESSRLQYLQSQLSKPEYANNADLSNSILEKIAATSQNMTTLLQDIRENTNPDKATFNMPSDVKALSYFEYVNSKGTNKNVSVGQGGIIVNMNIASVNANSPSDLQALGEAVVGGIKKNVANVNSSVSSNVNNRYNINKR